MRCVALLRGINLGHRNRIAMGTLCAIFEEHGGRDVRHHLQSGNIVFDASERASRSIARKVSASLATEHGLTVPIQLRAAADMARIVAANPFPEPAGELCVMFLADQPTSGALLALDANRGAPDRYLVVGSEIYLDVVTHLADTRLSAAYFDRALATVSTTRNWRTVEAILALCETA